MYKEANDIFLDSVFEHILSIAKGKCSLTDELIFSEENELHQKVLEGLMFLHQDIELYKLETRKAIETEYQLKILEEKNKQLEQFNYAASHDLKEPLRTISNFSSLVVRSNKDNLNKEGKEYLNYIIDASKRMWNLINGLSKYTKVGSERVLSQVNVRTLIDAVCIDLNAQIKDREVHFEIESLPTIHGFQLELRQLFQNLISNALKFSKPYQLLTINIKYQKVESGHQFSIKDNGIGIEKEQYKTIFEIFKRLNHKDEYEGTGVGLALCHRIVGMHYGKIWVESEPNQGSTFHFIISDDLA